MNLDQLGIDYEVIPGVSFFQAAAAALRTELTAPEFAKTIILTQTSGRTPMPKGTGPEYIGPNPFNFVHIFVHSQIERGVLRP